jgi:predicted transporter
MEQINDFLDFLFAITILDVLKAGLVMALVVYTIFAFIVARQVNLKRRTVESPLGNFLELLAIFHLLASILLTIFAILVL